MLADEMRRAATSMAMSIEEGTKLTSEKRENAFGTAAAKAARLAAALDVATIWKYIERPEETFVLLDRLQGLLHGLIHAKGAPA